MLIKGFGITDVGLKREGNEDTFSTDSGLGLHIVADGMGGHLAGEVASRIAVDMIKKSFESWRLSEIPQEEIFGPSDPSLSLVGNYLLGGIRLANRVIYELAATQEKYQGMGTTIAALVTHPKLVISANVGDSRIYLVRNGQIERLSKDHTIVAEQVDMGIMTEDEAETSPMKHILTRNLGSSEQVDAEIFELVPANRDRFILCSDGMTDLISDDEILAMVQEEEDPETLCKNFVKKALKRGGHDNTTVISLFVSGLEKPKAGALSVLGVALADLFIGIQRFVKKFVP